MVLFLAVAVEMASPHQIGGDERRKEFAVSSSSFLDHRFQTGLPISFFFVSARKYLILSWNLFLKSHPSFHFISSIELPDFLYAIKPLNRMKQLARYVRHVNKSQNGVLGIGKTGYGSYAVVPHQRWHLGNPKMGFLEEGPGLVGFVRSQHTMSRDWFNKIWAADKKVDRIREKKQQYDVSNWSPFLRATMKIENRWSSTQWRDDHGNDGMEYSVGATMETPATSQYVPPTSIEETKLAPLLSRSDLLITRDIEWANLMFAFEQESRFIIVDPNYPNSPVGSIVEKSNVIYRQLLRTRRPFIAYITDSYGNEIFRIRRPFWWINSTIYAEVDGKEIGVVHRRWHLWRRIYDLYLGKKQFAVVENPGFWDWTFTIKDEEEKVLAEINRDWRGFGLELFTDAGQYVIRFGPANSRSLLSQDTNIPELNIGRPLSISERAVAVALAVSLDCDYFSRRRGWGMPIMIGEE